ncbi:hypothetical protein [Guyparkeria sp.]|uniref:hypothetical protein n=1 Tax=Guyparkeria sp. TaxID=2035736 RepID=UPI003970A7A1
MAVRMSEKHVLHRIPLNGADDIDRLIFFHGLEAFGVVGPNLGSQRPVITRQAFYAFPQLPKALYLFVPLEQLEGKSRAERHAFIFQHADAYLFRWNHEHPESRLNARGSVPTFESERNGQYIHSDGGHTWVHGPFRCDIEEKAKAGPRRMTAEEVCSGQHLIDQRFKEYEQAIERLLDSWVVACDRFELLDEPTSTGGNPLTHGQLEERLSRRFPKTDTPTSDRAESFARMLLNQVPVDHPLLDQAEFSEEVFCYEPASPESMLLSYSVLMRLEQGLTSLGYFAEAHGLDRVLFEDGFLWYFVQPNGLDNPIPHCIVHEDHLYDELAMAYFVAGLDADRPHAQALGFYQTIENTTQPDGGSKAKAAVQNYLETMNAADLRRCYKVAINASEDALRLRGKKGGVDLSAMADLIVTEMRNPTVHSGTARSGQHQAIHPYASEQFTPRFNQAVRLSREIARHCVATSPCPLATGL